MKSKDGYPREWEEISEDKEAGCSRLYIHGGWLVISWTNYGDQPSESLVFVPDPSHYWKLEEIKRRKK